MSLNSKSNDPGATGLETQASRRFWRGRWAALIALLFAAILAAGTGWSFLHRRSPSGATGKDHPATAGSSAIRNVVLISIDTCRADHLSCYGYKRPTTPNIDAVARDGAMFKMAITPVPLTTPAHSSMLTGTYPPTHGVRLNSFDHLADSNVTLAKTLREAGYQTAAFVAAFPLDARFGLNQGFDTYDGRFSEETKTRFFSRRVAEEVNRPALAWLKGRGGQPFFLFLHYYDAHHPYEPHPPHTSAYAGDAYAGAIAYVDNCIGRVLDQLRAEGLYDNTLVIITGDHGEGLGEHDENSHGLLIYQTTLHVPLVIRAPGFGKGIQVNENVSLVDIMPTVLDLAGLKTPARVEGVSLRAALEGGTAPDRGTCAAGRRAIYGESLEAGTYACSPLYGILEGPWKYILAPRPELYELTQDPGERTDLAGRQPQVAQRLRGRLEAMLKELEAAAPRRGPSTVDLEAVKRLQSLGYVSGGGPLPSAGDATGEDPKDFLPTYQRLLQLAHTSGQAIDARRNEEARRELLEIAARRPAVILPHLLLADIALGEQRPADAAEQYARVVAMLGELKDPGKQRFGAREELAGAHFGLGLTLKQRGRPSEAIGEYEQALRIAPDFVDAHLNLGAALMQTGRLPEAVAHFQQALRIVPDFAFAHFNLAIALDMQGDAAQAATHYAEAIRLQADFPDALNNLAMIRATSDDPRLRDGPEAVRLAQQACRLSGRKAGVLDTLAAAYAEAGRFAEALQTARDALDHARQQNEPALVESIQAEIRLYETGKPFHKSPPAPAKSK